MFEGFLLKPGGVVLSPEYGPGLLGLADFSLVIVVTYLHRAFFDPARRLQ